MLSVKRSVISEATLRNDRTIVHRRKLYQIEEKIGNRNMMVCEMLDGSLVITHKERPETHRELAKRPLNQVQKKYPQNPGRTYRPPPADHRCRKFKIAFPNRKKTTAKAAVGAILAVFALWRRW